MTTQTRRPNTQTTTIIPRMTWHTRWVRPMMLLFMLTATLFVAVRLQIPAAAPAPQPYLGVRYSPVAPLGVRVDGVRYGSPAAAAGLEAGDVIFAVNERYLNDGNLAAALRDFDPADEITFSVRRGNQLHQIGATLGYPPTENAASELMLQPSQVDLSSLRAADITFDAEAWVWHLHDAAPGSVLHNAGLRGGDTIIMMDHQTLHVRNHHEMMTALLFRDVVPLTVDREGALVDVPVPGKLASLLLFDVDSAPRRVPVAVE